VGESTRSLRADDLDSSQRVRDHLVAYHLAPTITDFILDEDQECSNNELEQTLTLLHNEWSKEIEPSKQNSTHHPLIVNNPIDKKGSEFMRRNMQWGKMAVSEDYASCQAGFTKISLSRQNKFGRC